MSKINKNNNKYCFSSNIKKTFIELISFIIIITLLLSFASCFFDVYRGPYIFWRQDRSNIEKIEVYTYQFLTSERTLIAELPKEATDEIIDEISTYQCSETFGDFPREYTKIMLCITYSNGEIELLSLINIGYITPKGEQYITNYIWDLSAEQSLYNLICRYVDPEIIGDFGTAYGYYYGESSID